MNEQILNGTLYDDLNEFHQGEISLHMVTITGNIGDRTITGRVDPTTFKLCRPFHQCIFKTEEGKFIDTVLTQESLFQHVADQYAMFTITFEEKCPNGLMFRQQPGIHDVVTVKVSTWGDPTLLIGRVYPFCYQFTREGVLVSVEKDEYRIDAISEKKATLSRTKKGIERTDPDSGWLFNLPPPVGY